MANALSLDLRCRLVAAVMSGASCRQTASRFGVSASSAIRWVAQVRETGDVAPKPRGGPRRRSRIEPHGDLIMRWLDETPDITLPEIAAKLDEAVGYRPPPSVVHEFFKRRGVTRKKDSARCRAGSSGRSTEASGLVQSPARSRPCAPRFYR